MIMSLPTTDIAADHRTAWADRLEDLLDGNLADTERDTVEKHVAECEMCRADVAALRELDAALTSQIVAPRLDAEFDRKVRAQIASYDESARARARARAELERAREESKLASSWRSRKQRMLLDGIALAGCLCALAFTFLASGMLSTLENKLSGLTGLGALALVITAISACVGVVLRSRDE
jgi:anti-sigma factor RsiW